MEKKAVSESDRLDLSQKNEASGAKMLSFMYKS